MPKTVFSPSIVILLLALFCLIRPSPLQATPSVTQIDAGDSTSLAIDSDGRLWSWGKNQLNGYDAHRPVLIAHDVIMARAAKGEPAIYFITRDKTLWATGSSQYGQLGLKTNGFILKPLMLLPHIVYIDAGHDTPFAIDEKGRLWTWGDDSPAKGQSARTDSVPPFPASLVRIADDIVQVSSAFSHTLALKKDGSLLAWGDNESGELGDGTVIPRHSPVRTDLTALGTRKIIRIATRAGESFALADDGTLWSWGKNWAYPAELDKTSPVLTPAKVTGIDHIRDFAPGWGHILFLKQDGTVWIAGSGIFANTFRRTPPPGHSTEVSSRWSGPRQLLAEAARIASGPNHILILKKDGSLLAAGSDSYGELIKEYDPEEYDSGNVPLFLTISLPR